MIGDMRVASVALMLCPLLIVPGSAAAQTFKSLCDFSDGSNGGVPQAGVAVGPTGIIYGTTTGGGITAGVQGHGTVFQCKPAHGIVATLHKFHGTADGSDSFAGVTVGPDGALYGVSFNGGGKHFGEIFRIDPTTKIFTPLFSFKFTDGGVPQSPVAFNGSTLYGTAEAGGKHDAGTVFAFDINTRKLTTVYNFKGEDDGKYPNSALIFDTAGNLYGTTSSGGSTGYGVVYKLDPTTKHETALYSFASTDGTNISPAAPLAVTASGIVYGARSSGGGFGEIFEVDPAKKTEASIYYFTDGADGGTPYGGITLGPDGRLYGTTSAGGANGAGTVFAFDTTAKTLTTLYNFGSVQGGYGDGAFSYASVVFAGPTLYGTTSGGGAGLYGTVFQLTP